LALKYLIEEDYQLSFKNCLGLATDGANNVAGKNNSLWTRFKAAAPQAIQLKCICHSYDLVLKKAMEHPLSIPSSLTKLLHAVPTFFSNSSIRREGFQDISATINQDGYNQTRKPFAKHNDTRWLSRSKVMDNLIGNYTELIVYFQSLSKDTPGANQDETTDKLVKFDASTLLRLMKVKITKQKLE